MSLMNYYDMRYYIDKRKNQKLDIAIRYTGINKGIIQESRTDIKYNRREYPKCFYKSYEVDDVDKFIREKYSKKNGIVNLIDY